MDKKDGEAEDNGEVTTFFDSLNLGDKPGKGKTKFSEKVELEEEEEDEELDEEEDEEEDSKLSPEIIAMQEQLKLAQEQNAKFMQLLLFLEEVA